MDLREEFRRILEDDGRTGIEHLLDALVDAAEGRTKCGTPITVSNSTDRRTRFQSTYYHEWPSKE
jgi:hypothetical protein